MRIAVRPYEARDFPGALSLVQRSDDGAETIKRLMPLLTDDGAPAGVAEDGQELVGLAVGAAAGGTGWILGAATAGRGHARAPRRRGRSGPR